MAEVTNEVLLQAIMELANEMKEVREEVNQLKLEVNDLKAEMKEMKTELKGDIRKLDRNFQVILRDLTETRADVAYLQQIND